MLCTEAEGDKNPGGPVFCRLFYVRISPTLYSANGQVPLGIVPENRLALTGLILFRIAVTYRTNGKELTDAPIGADRDHTIIRKHPFD